MLYPMLLIAILLIKVKQLKLIKNIYRKLTHQILYIASNQYYPYLLNLIYYDYYHQLHNVNFYLNHLNLLSILIYKHSKIQINQLLLQYIVSNLLAL
jgi:hypothetical protein